MTNDDVDATPDGDEPTADADTPDSPAAADVEKGGAEGGSSVATGILAAERKAQTDIARRRRLLIGTGVLGLVIALAVLAVMTVLQQQANREAEEAADRAEARAAFAVAVVERAEAYEPPAVSIQRDAAELRSTLGELVAATELNDAELGRRIEVLLADLDAQKVVVDELRSRAVPEPDDLVSRDRAVTVLRELETLRAEAGALVDEVPLASNDVRTWVGVVQDVNMAVAAHIEQVESEESTNDPDELIELWRAERPALLRLSAAASAADDVAGLETWAAAHAAYAQDLLAWIDEAVALLEDGDLDTYNERFDDIFADDDPFGFNAAVAAATESALASPALLQLATLDQRAQLVLDTIDATEMVTAEQLDDTAAADTVDTADTAE